MNNKSINKKYLIKLIDNEILAIDQTHAYIMPSSELSFIECKTNPKYMAVPNTSYNMQKTNEYFNIKDIITSKVLIFIPRKYMNKFEDIKSYFEYPTILYNANAVKIDKAYTIINNLYVYKDYNAISYKSLCKEIIEDLING